MIDRPACRLAAVLAIFMGLPGVAGETPPSGRTDTNAGAVFRARFESISTADFAAGSPAMESTGVSLVPGRTGLGVEIGPDGRVEIGSAGNLPPAQGTLSFWFKPKPMRAPS